MGTNEDLNADLQAAVTTYTTRYNEVITDTLPGVWQLYTDKIDVSNSGTWKNHMIGRIPAMKKRTAALEFERLRSYNFTATAERYYAALKIDRLTMKRDGLGVISSNINKFLSRGSQCHDKFSAQEFDSASGVGPTGYDGVALFHATHPHVESGSGASNIGAGTRWTHANYGAARAIMSNRHDEAGEPMGPQMVTHVRVHPTIEQRTMEILNTDQVIKFTNASAAEATSTVIQATPIDNVLKGSAQIIVDHRIPTAQQYHATLMDLSGDAKPMVLIEERAPEPLEITDMDSFIRVMEDNFAFLLEAEYKATAGMWQTCYRLTGTT